MKGLNVLLDKCGGASATPCLTNAEQVPNAVLSPCVVLWSSFASGSMRLFMGS